MNMRQRSPRTYAFIFVGSLLLAAGALLGDACAHANDDETVSTRLQGHVPSAVARATLVDGSRESAAPHADEAPLVLTVVLARDDESGFRRFLDALYDPSSPEYRRFLSSKETSDRFGPSQQAYDGVLHYLVASGFKLVESSSNRLTLVVEGSTAAAEKAFGVHVRTYASGGSTFRAHAEEPVLPAEIARHVEAIVGLSNLAKPRPALKAIAVPFCALDAFVASFLPVQGASETRAAWEARVWACYHETFDVCMQIIDRRISGSNNGPNPADNYYPSPECDTEPPPPPGSLRAQLAASSTLWTDVDGTGQTVALLEFDNFHLSDVRDFLELIGAPPSRIDQLTSVAVNGGAEVGPEETEVLLDIAEVMLLAPGADVVVYHAPFSGRGTSFQALLNAAIDDGVSIISNSWAYCEDQTTLADVESIESILQAAAASGISVFSASGDSGSTCLDGAANTVAVPAGAPTLTAVGGSSLVSGPGQTYGSETWWNGSGDTPPSGQGGFGASRFFNRPDYQDGLTGAAKRSVPDVVANADPANGIFLCQASAGGCPTGLLYGGTSAAAPVWAAFTALLNEAQGENLGFLNPLIYPLSDTDAFHDAVSLGSDFAHVGLGSPNLSVLSRALSDTPIGMVSAETSEVVVDKRFAPPLTGIPADGATAANVVVRLRDANGHTVSGKTVVLDADPPGNVEIAPASANTTVDNGAANFEVKSLAPETVTFTATDTTDGVVLDASTTITFTVPQAASAGIQAFPTSVAAAGVTATTITVTLQDGLARPAAGKLVTLSQGTGRSVISGPSPSVTDANGQIEFTATNRVNETVTYTAVDVTDGELPVPGQAVVTFSGSAGTCLSANLPTGDNGFVVEPFATGFAALGDFPFGGVNWGGCPGASYPAFRGSDAFIANFRTGDLYRLPSSGGAASSANLLETLGPTIGFPVIGHDGRLYATFGAATSSFPSGSVVELDLDTGAVVRTLTSGEKCPGSLAVDPLSGDLFFSHQCFGGSAEDATITRIRNPGGAATVETYVTLPVTANGQLAFAPDGTLFVAANYVSATPAVIRIAGTDKPSPPAMTALSDVPASYWVTIGEVGANGEALSLIGTTPQGLELFDISGGPATRTVIAHDIGSGIIGPDGCLYASRSDSVWRLRRDDGSCGFAPTGALPTLTLWPSAVTPDPAQGSELTFVATLQNVDAPEDTPITFAVRGANPRVLVVRADAAGTATFSYMGDFTGDDVITATTDVDGAKIDSNRARATWQAGRHVSFLSLATSPTVGMTGETSAVVASLTDDSVAPPAAVPGATVDFSLDGGAECSAVTDTDGLASCELRPRKAGVNGLVATFEGTGSRTPATATIGFNALCGTCGDATGDKGITASDALIALRTAVGSDTCAPCLCDANTSNSVTASDALAILRHAVGHPVTLNCPAA
jgi:kumamolisin